MKKFLFISLIILFVFSLLGCQQNTTKRVEQNTEMDIKDFVEPEPSDWVTYSTIVNKYMYYRTQAVVNNDIHLLWNQYPDLKNSIDDKKGINVEVNEVEFLNKNFKLIDANYSIESNERIKVKTLNKEEVIVRVHGGISYLRNDFGESGGEHLLEITLKLINNQWTVVKTDEYTQSEYKEWIKKNQ